jgi:hypothetical protein
LTWNILAAHHLILAAPLFPMPPHGAFSSVSVIAAVAVGIACGLLAWVLTGAVYGADDPGAATARHPQRQARRTCTGKPAG